VRVGVRVRVRARVRVRVRDSCASCIGSATPAPAGP
jgi:hypothetical protein